MTSDVHPGDPRRRELDDEILKWMRELNWQRDDTRFETLAIRLFAFQFAYCEPYSRFCEARGITPANVSSWRDIPAVPTSAFKETRLQSFHDAKTIKTFNTSGTTTSRRGALHLDTLALYEASLLPSIERFVFPDIASGQARMPIRILAASPAFAPDSSLSHMFGMALDVRGDGNSGYDCPDGVLDAEPLIERLVALDRAYASDSSAAPVALCGTSFAFVHLLDAFGDAKSTSAALSLPPGSRIMETGGFKGRSREVSRHELYSALTSQLGIAEDHIVNQYGMTELGSQFYDSQLYEAHASFQSGEEASKEVGPRRKLGPPWVRTRLLDPETGDEAKTGEPGMIVVHDLANTGSTAAIQTADLGRRVTDFDDGFDVLGRAEGADARGCSLAADEAWLEAQPR
ncbi:MAG: acyl-CoA synthetase (AMP-forming)/AMP-acid ligase II [Myxococcota bacterium]|jgi:acyl-CoA synthetase (AMP-forming)/AMP-acid ligase II